MYLATTIAIIVSSFILRFAIERTKLLIIQKELLTLSFCGFRCFILCMNEVHRDAIYCTLLDCDTTRANFKFKYKDRPNEVEI